MEVKEIDLKGHIIDSFILPQVFDTIMDLGGEFEVLEFEIGKKKDEPSFTRILVKGKDIEQLDNILGELHKLGAKIPEVGALELKAAPEDRTLPRNFYSTTNHPTRILLGDRWINVRDMEMDMVVVVDKEKEDALCKPISDVTKGDLIVVGTQGIRVEPPARPRGYSVFEFMRSSVSSEKPTSSLVRQIAKEMVQVKARGKKILVVSGPAVVHTGAGAALAGLISDGHVDVLFGGNALAVHDIESQLYGTSLGVDISTNKPAEGGHRNHLYAINEVMLSGSIKKLIEEGKISGGIMYEAEKKRVPTVLAGSIRDDGPLPEVITDAVESQRAMREHLKDVELVLMLATTLHSIAVGNLLKSTAKTICVDINPATVTKLADRGSAQALGIVTDVGAFLPLLADELKKLRAAN